MFKRVIPKKFEKNDGIDHPELQHVNTRVSEYLRKYGTGQFDKMPSDNRQQINDPRSVEEMLAEGEMVPGLGTDELDVMMELDRMKERYNEAVESIELAKSDKIKFEKAVQIINDSNASDDAKYDAYRILEELEKQGKITRARD